MADFSFQTEQDGAGNGRLNGEYDHWALAAGNVVFWQSFLTLNLAIPVVAFHKSFDQKAEYVTGEKKWRWTYSFDEGQHTYKAKLIGKLDGDAVKWEMYVTKSGVYEDFLWYSGTSSLDEKHGSWIVYGNPDGDRKPVLSIDWKRESDKIAEIKYTNIQEGSNDKGSYIYYGSTGKSDFDVFYDVNLKSEGSLVEIEYNTTTKIGRVKSKKHFGDELTRCWNSNLVNIEC